MSLLYDILLDIIYQDY